MPPRREPRTSAENNFLDLGQFGEVIANAIQFALRLTPRNTLDIVSRLKINELFGNEGVEKSAIWLDLVEKTFRIMERQGNLPSERWVDTTTWFLHLGAGTWWGQEKIADRSIFMRLS